MSHSLGYGTSSGDLNTGDNLSESSFLEALFGLEFGHADFADDADFSSLLFVCPTDFCPMRAGISQMMQMTQIFLLCCLFVPQIFALCGLGFRR